MAHIFKRNMDRSTARGAGRQTNKSSAFFIGHAQSQGVPILTYMDCAQSGEHFQAAKQPLILRTPPDCSPRQSASTVSEVRKAQGTALTPSANTPVRASFLEACNRPLKLCVDASNFSDFGYYREVVVTGLPNCAQAS